MSKLLYPSKTASSAVRAAQASDAAVKASEEESKDPAEEESKADAASCNLNLEPYAAAELEE